MSTEQLISLAEHPATVAIGETGLDYHHHQHTAPAQKVVFLRHIEAARLTGLPLVIHSRAADEDMAMILKEESKKGDVAFILHCFSASEQLAMTCLELGDIFLSPAS